MPVYILKATPGQDFYVEWSTQTDGPTWAGSRAEFLAVGLATAERLDRADATGTSAHDPDNGGWDDPGLWVRDAHHNDCRVLPRERLGEYVTHLLAGRTAAAGACTQPPTN